MDMIEMHSIYYNNLNTEIPPPKNPNPIKVIFSTPYMFRYQKALIQDNLLLFLLCIMHVHEKCKNEKKIQIKVSTCLLLTSLGIGFVKYIP